MSRLTRKHPDSNCAPSCTGSPRKSCSRCPNISVPMDINTPSSTMDQNRDGRKPRLNRTKKKSTFAELYLLYDGKTLGGESLTGKGRSFCECSRVFAKFV